MTFKLMPHIKTARGDVSWRTRRVAWTRSGAYVFSHDAKRDVLQGPRAAGLRSNVWPSDHMKDD
jgi:hypothetical protein